MEAPTTTTTDAAARLAPEAFAERAQAIEREVGKVIVGQRELVRQTLTGLLAGGHVLLEGVPGLGKTMLVRTLADVIDCTFNRIQFTPDLMPADITGTNILIEEAGQRVFRFQPGPIFANLVLADEINRATPKTQSACSRRCRSTRSRSPASASRSIRRSSSWPPRTRSRWRAPIPCPRPSSTGSSSSSWSPSRRRRTSSRSWIARPAPRASAPRRCARRPRSSRCSGSPGRCPIAPHVTAYAVSVLAATHPDQPRAPGLVREYVRYGGSPRGAQALVTAGKIYALLDGRFNVSTDDIRAVALPALRHRIILNFEGEAEGITSEAVVRAILDAVAVPTVE